MGLCCRLTPGAPRISYAISSGSMSVCEAIGTQKTSAAVHSDFRAAVRKHLISQLPRPSERWEYERGTMEVRMLYNPGLDIGAQSDVDLRGGMS